MPDVGIRPLFLNVGLVHHGVQSDFDPFLLGQSSQCRPQHVHFIFERNGLFPDQDAAKLIALFAEDPLMTGYELAKEFNCELAEFWYANHSQIYPELKKLHSEQLVIFDVEISGSST